MSPLLTAPPALGYLFIADTEVIDRTSDAKCAARTNERSISGCFIETRNPAPAGRELWIRISQRHSTFATFGCVVSVVPNTGMSVAFASMEPNQLSVLEKWLPAAI
jgi:hypothetical protein